MLTSKFLAMEPTKYSDWFGSGDTHSDFKDAVGDGPLPDEVLVSENGTMLILLWPDRAMCVGYDGGEYCHSFDFVRENPDG